MSSSVNIYLILGAALLATGSPGPATLAIAGTSLSQGRRAGLALATGVCIGSLFWSAMAAFGLGTLMLAHVWLFETVRYLGAAYLIFLAWKAARSAMSSTPLTLPDALASDGRVLRRGLMLHLTNPKAILFFGSLYSLGIPAGASAGDLLLVLTAVGVQSTLVFVGYALLFSIPRVINLYLRLRRVFEAAFALAFAAAGIKILTTSGSS